MKEESKKPATAEEILRKHCAKLEKLTDLLSAFTALGAMEEYANTKVAERALPKERAYDLLVKHDVQYGSSRMDILAESLSGLIPSEEKQWLDFDKQMDDGLYVVQTISGETYLSTYTDGEWDVDYLNTTTPEYVIPISFPPAPKHS